MERRRARRSSILRPNSQFEIEQLETVEIMSTQDGGSEPNTEFTSTTIRRSMKRVSFANKIEEVRFYDKDNHGSPVINRVMPAAGTDAHHSLLNDPVLLAPPTESLPSDGMDISYEATRVDENTDPSFIPDDLPYSGDDIFDKSAYISMGDNAAESTDELLDDLGSTPPVESGDVGMDLGEPCTPDRDGTTCDKMPLEDIERSMLFIHTPLANRTGLTEVFQTSVDNPSCLDSSVSLPDVSRPELSDMSISKSVIRAAPVPRRLPSLRPMELSPDSPLEYRKRSIVCDDNQSEDMDISNVATCVESISAINHSPFAHAAAPAMGFLTSTMVSSGQKCKVVDSDSDMSVSSQGSPPKRARIEIPVTKKVAQDVAHRRQAVNRAVDTTQTPKLDKVLNAYPTMELRRLEMSPFERSSVPFSAPAIDTTDDVNFDAFGSIVETFPRTGPLCEAMKHKGEAQNAAALKAFKENFNAQVKEKQSEKKRKVSTSDATLGRKIRGGHLLKCYWIESVGFTLENKKITWGGSPACLRFRRSSATKLDNFLNGDSPSIDYFELVLPMVYGSVRVHLGEPYLIHASKKNRALHFDISSLEFVPGETQETNNEELFVMNVLEASWKAAQPKLETFKSTEAWKDLMALMSNWAECSGQILHDLDLCFAKLPAARLSFKTDKIAHFEVPHPLLPALSSDIEFDFSKKPYPDCPVAVTNVCRGGTPLDSAVGNRIGDEMVKSFQGHHGLFGMGRVIGNYAARFKSRRSSSSINY